MLAPTQKSPALVADHQRAPVALRLLDGGGQHGDESSSMAFILAWNSSSSTPSPMSSSEALRLDFTTLPPLRSAAAVNAARLRAAAGSYGALKSQNCAVVV